MELAATLPILGIQALFEAADHHERPRRPGVAKPDALTGEPQSSLAGGAGLESGGELASGHAQRGLRRGRDPRMVLGIARVGAADARRGERIDDLVPAPRPPSLALAEDARLLQEPDVVIEAARGAGEVIRHLPDRERAFGLEAPDDLGAHRRGKDLGVDDVWSLHGSHATSL